MAKALIGYSAIKMLDDDGTIVSEEFIEFTQPKEDLVPHKAGTSWHPILQRYLPDSVVDREMLVDESELFPNGEEEDDDPIIDANGNIVEKQPDKDETGETKDGELVTSTEPVLVRLRPKFYKGEKENPYVGLADPLPSPQELAKHYFWYWESTLYRDPNFVVGKVNDFIEHGINILFREYRELERFVKVVDSIKAADAPLEEKAFVAFAFAGTMTWAAELTWEENANAVDWLCYFKTGGHE